MSQPKTCNKLLKRSLMWNETRCSLVEINGRDSVLKNLNLDTNKSISASFIN